MAAYDHRRNADAGRSPEAQPTLFRAVQLGLVGTLKGHRPYSFISPSALSINSRRHPIHPMDKPGYHPPQPLALHHPLVSCLKICYLLPSQDVYSCLLEWTTLPRSVAVSRRMTKLRSRQCTPDSIFKLGLFASQSRKCLMMKSVPPLERSDTSPMLRRLLRIVPGIHF